jgi:dsDNA-specific endonuclease/ATPase MutS2
VEILDYQISIFRRELDKAIDTRAKKIIFIHGIGNGRLKFEIIKILKTYKKIEFQDASYQKYGFGATEVLIK